MKRRIHDLVIVIAAIFFVSGISGCKKISSTVKYTVGTFPVDTTIAISEINTAYDDYNSDIALLYGGSYLIFSSNRGSSGGQFDLVQSLVEYTFSQETGAFDINFELSSDAYITKLLSAANTAGNDYGPYTLFSSLDGYEYLLLSSENGENLDFYYLKHMPASGVMSPAILGPYEISLLNTSSDDAYISLDANQDSLYYSTNKEGNFNIYVTTRESGTDLTEWFNSDYGASTKPDSINTSYEDKCPFVNKKVMVFASNRPGGMGGYDLYYSEFKKGKWSSPNNFGPEINTAYDEYRPIISTQSDFSNYLMIYSSNKPGGKGGFDLYYTGVNF